jgi:hypothetical protein
MGLSSHEDTVQGEVSVSQGDDPDSQANEPSGSGKKSNLASDSQARPGLERSDLVARRGAEGAQPQFSPTLEEREIIHGKGLGMSMFVFAPQRIPTSRRGDA